MITLDSLLHTTSIYTNRWAGARVRCYSLMKFVNAFLLNRQIELLSSKAADCRLSEISVIDANFKPRQVSSISFKGLEDFIEIEDELGVTSCFAEGTQILVTADAAIQWKKIENVTVGDFKVINLEKHATSIDKAKVIMRTSKNPNKTACEEINFLRLPKIEKNRVSIEHSFESSSIQQLYAVKIVRVEKVGKKPSFDLSIANDSFFFSKSKSAKSKKTKAFNQLRSSRYRKLLYSKIIEMKKEDLCPFEFTVEKANNQRN